MFELANPNRFMEWSGRLLPWLGAAAATALLAGLALGFAAAPDYRQGDTVGIMFLHVPSAWTAMMAYGLMAAASVVGVVNRHPLADVAARAAAPLGAMFAALGLVTGSLWSKPMWGVWWVWAGRPTSFLLLLLIYLGYIALGNAIEDETHAARACAVLAVVGAVNLPIIEFSVDWWAALHQSESVLRMGGPLIAPVLLRPLFLMTLAYTMLFLILWIIRIRTEVLARRVRAMMMAGVQ